MLPAIEIQSLSKKYFIHEKQKYYALRDSISRLIFNPTQIFKSVKKDSFWALKDISLTISKGDVVGIIGRNGAGKSTLLKVLSRITPPTNGSAILRGKVASMLEVGTGFHPELSGRENIYLSGAILGMKASEVTKKMDSIIEFAGIEKFLDTPVKHYSSGMYVRLAFSVAAHLDPDILLVDEVLAVGDSEFQRKSLGKMEEVTSVEGRTIIFVSHNMGAIQSLCNKCLYLDKGRIIAYGETKKVVQLYLQSVSGSASVTLKERRDRKGSGAIRATKITLRDNNGKDTNYFKCGDDVEVLVDYEVVDKTVKQFEISLSVDSFVTQNRLACMATKMMKRPIKVTEKHQIRFKIRHLPLNVGRYQFNIWIDHSGALYDWVQKAWVFDVEHGDFYKNNGEILDRTTGEILFDYTIEDI